MTTWNQTLSIRNTLYSLTPASHPGGRAWQLENHSNGKSYTVAVTSVGATCTCPNYKYHHEGADTPGCKHVQALRDSGHLDLRQPHPAETILASIGLPKTKAATPAEPVKALTKPLASDLDPEVGAMAAIVQALAPLDPAAIRRVLGYAESRFGAQPADS